MSRRYHSESVEVTEHGNGDPAGFRWRGRRYTVRVIVAAWVEGMPGWVGRARGQRPAQRQVWRVEAAPRTGTTGVYDLYRASRTWGLERVID